MYTRQLGRPILMPYLHDKSRTYDVLTFAALRIYLALQVHTPSCANKHAVHLSTGTSCNKIFPVPLGTLCTSPRTLLFESMHIKTKLIQQVLQTIWRCMINASGPLSANTVRRAWFQAEIHRNTRRLFDKAPNGKSEK